MCVSESYSGVRFVTLHGQVGSGTGIWGSRTVLPENASDYRVTHDVEIYSALKIPAIAAGKVQVTMGNQSIPWEAKLTKFFVSVYIPIEAVVDGS